MKQSEYIKLSEREGIEDKDICTIVNHIERMEKGEVTYNDLILELGNIEIAFGDLTEVYFHGDVILSIPINWLADNVVGIYRNIKSLK